MSRRYDYEEDCFFIMHGLYLDVSKSRESNNGRGSSEC